MEPKAVGHLSGDTGAACDIEQPRGLATGTIVLTMTGETPVEEIKAGDRVITRDSGVAVVKAVRRRRITTRAVRIIAGSLGHTRPERDVVVPAAQEILIRDWRAEALFGRKQALVPAARLADGEFVTVTGETEMVVHEIGFDTPHIIYADGLEVASHMPAAELAEAA